MFIEQHLHTDEEILLTFIKSLNVQVHPCGRRRSELIDRDGKTDTTSDQYHIPFDPEARLNTEFNNRRRTSANGFTDSYITGWDAEKKTFSFTVGGYAFTINLTARGSGTDIETIQAFGDQIITSLNADSNCKKIYANIKLEEIPLYNRNDGVTEYTTWIIRNQSQTQSQIAYASNELDILKNGNSSVAANYYFSGLSFSTRPITDVKDPVTNEYLTSSSKFIPGKNLVGGEYETRAQQEYSLCILAKKDGTWHLYEPAKLPHIEHGELEDSVKVGHLDAKSISYNGHPVAVFDINHVKDNIYQLHLYNATEASNFGTAESITGEFIINGNNTNNVVIVNEDEITLNFSEADLAAGRPMDAWWAGIKIFAPKGINTNTLEKATYRVPEGDTWSANRSFWTNKDSADDAERHFITIWLPVTAEYIDREISSGDGYLTLVYQFDWFGKGYEDSQQTFTFKVDVTKVNLIPAAEA